MAAKSRQLLHHLVIPRFTQIGLRVCNANQWNISR